MSNIFLILFLFLLLLNPNPNSSLSSDGLSLIALKYAIDQSSNSSVFSNWDETDLIPCKWSGISCMNITGLPYPRVTGIDLSDRNLHGYIPSELGSLKFLRKLNLHGNQFYGSIPDQIFNASYLQTIFINSNNLSGTLPTSFYHLHRLQNLDLSENSFSGSIPIDIKNCRELRRLILAKNKFSGQIPTGIWSNLEYLVQLDLSSNQFTGSIPSDLGELKSLYGTLNLSFNQLSGEIPKSLEKLPLIVNFDFRNNNLSGEIPQNGTFTNQGITSFLDNPLLCGFPLKKSCQIFSSEYIPPQSNHSKKGLKPSLIILITIANLVGVGLIVIIILFIYSKRKNSNDNTGKSKIGGTEEDEKMCWFCGCTCLNGFKSNKSEIESEKEGDSGEEEEEEIGGGLVSFDKSFKFELDELLGSSAYLLGNSGFGFVYKVVLASGIPVAVRRLGGGGGVGRYKEFAAEIQAIGKLKHPNVVKLRAYYWALEEKLIICDFISNGNLLSALHGKSGEKARSLSWTTRLKIAKGIARGLAYIHGCSPQKYVHGNIKPTNILLDNEFNPYISDFGLDKLIKITGTGSNTSSSASLIGGSTLPYVKLVQEEKTNNYKAPESRTLGTKPTQKWDVYSFGVVLLEMLTGKSPNLWIISSASSSMVKSVRGEVGDDDLVKWVRKGFEEKKPLLQMVDMVLLEDINVQKEVLAAFHVSLACTELNPELRPKMKTVFDNLDRIGR